MAKKPTLSCINCHKPMWDNRNSGHPGLPQGRAMCNDCRTKRATRPRVCRGCGKVFQARRTRGQGSPWCGRECYDRNRKVAFEARSK